MPVLLFTKDKGFDDSFHHDCRFFGFGGPAKKKSSTTAPPVAALLQQGSAGGVGAGAPPMGRRRGSDRSLSGSAHELAVSGVRDAHHQKVPHSHSQSNLSDIPYRLVRLWSQDLSSY